MADINVNPQDFEQFIQNLTRGGAAANDFSNANKVAADSIKKNAAALDKLEEFLKGLGSTVLSTEKGTGKYATSVTAATDAVGDIASKFGVLGAVAGGLIKILGGLAAASLKQNDALIKSYRSLSEFGNMDFSVDNIEKLKNDLAALGTTAENSAYIAQLIGKLAPDLVAFGGSVTKGKDEIFKLTSGLLNNKFEDQLNNLGYKTEEITEISSRYVAQLARIGATQGKSTDQLRVSAFNYMTVLQQLSDLTGQSRDSLQAQIDEQNRDVAFRAYLRTLSKEDATAAQAAIQAITAIGGKSMGDAAKEMAELNGGVRTAKSAMMQMYNPDLFDMYQQAMKSKNPAVLMADEFRKRAPQINAAVNNLVGGVTAGGADMADALGQSTDLYDALERITALKDLNPEEYKKKVAELVAQTNGRLAEGKKQEQNERRMQNAYQQLIYSIGDQAVPMITKLTTALNTMGYMVAKFVKGLTGVDYTGIFETFENYNEAAKAITEEEANQIELKKQSEVLQKKLDEEIKKKTDAAAKGKLSKFDANGFDMDIRQAKDDLNAVRNQMAASRGRQENARIAQTGFTGGAPVTTGTSETGAKGIRMKAGAQAEGRTVDPALSALAKTISDQIPNFTYISSMNDDFHKNLIERNGKISKHALGKALDFTLANKPTDEEGQAMVSLLRSMGASYARDEYNHPSDKAIGNGHMHVEVARKGGLFNGPSSGYPVMLHGKETVLPTKALDNLVSKLPLPGTLFGEGNNSNMSNTDDLINALNGVQGVLDTLAETFRRSLGVQEDILTHTKMLA